MGGNPPDPRVILADTTGPKSRLGAPLARALGSSLNGWGSGVLVFVLLGFACVDRLSWGLSLLPVASLAAFLAVRAAAEWPRVGFPACVMGVASFTVAAGLFRAGIGWTREWDALRNAGTLAPGAGGSPVLGMGLAILLGGSFLGVLFLHGETIWRTLSSIRLAVVTLAAIGTFSVIGTMVVQRFGAGALPEKEQVFVEKFLKGQGSIPVSARFMVAPPARPLTAEEQEKARLTEEAFGAGKGRQMRLGLTEMHFKAEKEMAIDAHVKARREHLLRLFERLETLGFTNVFHTWWFNALFLLLFTQVVAVLAKRYPWGWPQAGWVMTHVGVLTVLAGAVISDAFMKDGAVGLSPRETVDRFDEYTRPDPTGEPAKSPLGYRLKMLGTDQSFYHELQIGFLSVKAGDDILWTREQLRPGRRFGIRDPETRASYEVRILESHERARVGEVMVSGKAVGRTDGIPVLRVRYFADAAGHGGEGHAVDEGYLFADGFYSGRVPAYALQYRVAATGEEARGLLAWTAPPGQGRYGSLRVLLPEAPEPVVLPATPGASVSATTPDGKAWTLEVARYHPSYWVGKKPTDDPPDDDGFPEKPALEVEVRRGAGADGAEEKGRMLVYADESLQSQWEAMARQAAGHAGKSEGMHGASLRFGGGPSSLCSYRFAFAPPVQTWVVEGPGVPRTFVVHRPGAPSETADFSKPGAEMALGAQGLSVRLLEALPDGVPDLRIEGLGEESDEEYLASCLQSLRSGVPPEPTTAAVRIEVREKDGKGERTRTEWLVAGRRGEFQGRNFESSDGRLVLALSETQNAMMFRSAMEVQSLDGKAIEVDGKPVRHVVRVNHPLHWGGYAFYQNSFIPASGDGPAGSVFRVKYDRGIPTLYTGFAILTLGVCIMLYLNPALRRRRGGPAAAGSAGEAAGA